MAYRVVITDAEFESFAVERSVLDPIGVDLVLSPSLSEDTLAELCRDADAIAVQNGPLPASVIEQCEKCRVIVSYGIGYDSIDIASAQLKQIPVANVPRFCVDEVADHAFMLLLAVSRKLLSVHSATIGGGVWGYKSFTPVWRMSGRTLGIVGLGKIGSSVARRANGFGLRVLASDPYVSAEVFAQHGAESVPLDVLLGEADYVTMHCCLTNETRGMIGPAQLRCMKPTAYLVNTSRGAVVKQEALLWALGNGEIAGAAIDVFEDEPLPAEVREALKCFENVIVTPHMAWYSEEALAELQRKVAWIIRDVLEGRRPASIVNGL